jgi:hypothetical protein
MVRLYASLRSCSKPGARLSCYLRMRVMQSCTWAADDKHTSIAEFRLDHQCREWNQVLGRSRVSAELELLPPRGVDEVGCKAAFSACTASLACSMWPMTQVRAADRHCVCMAVGAPPPGRAGGTPCHERTCPIASWAQQEHSHM